MTGMPAVSTTTYPDQDALEDALHALNEAGADPELAAVDATGSPFLAALTEPDADMAIVTTAEDGRATGRFACQECGAPGPVDWAPTYPVTAFIAVVDR